MTKTAEFGLESNSEVLLRVKRWTDAFMGKWGRIELSPFGDVLGTFASLLIEGECVEMGNLWGFSSPHRMAAGV